MRTTEDFLRRVVPESGTKFISIDFGGGRWIDYAAEDYDDMLGMVETYLDRPANIYHANATFTESSRRADCAHLMRTFWLDLDVQKERGPSYPSQKAALADAKRFVAESGMPKPSLLVSSGKGLHVYWCLSADLPAAEWLPLAQALKKLTQTHNLLADPTVTADRARVLRPVGTFWRDVKNGTPVIRPVALVWENPTPTVEIATLQKALGAPLGDATPRPQLALERGANAALRAPADAVDYSGSDPNRIADKCGRMGQFRKSGDLPYSQWWLCIGVLVRADDGERYAHEWSANDYERYDPIETQQKLDTWNVPGATTCQEFRDNDPNGICVVCPHRCNSPLALGYPTHKPEVFATETGTTEVFTPIAFPEGAEIRQNGTLWFQMPIRVNGERVMEMDYACKPPFYFTSIAVRPDGKLESDAVCFPRKGERRTFIFPHDVAQDNRSLIKLLNGYGIYGNSKVIGAYVVSYLESLRNHVNDTLTYQQMGWTKDRKGFLLGNRLVTAASVDEVRVSGNMRNKANLYDDSRSPEQWMYAVDKLYNCRTGQPYQFAICAAFGSALVPILDAEEFNGIPVALTSDESGYGKSTVCKIALSAFGKVERNVNVLTGDEVSVGAVEVQCSTFNHVPHLFDEMTNKQAHDVSHILYMLSNGVARARLRQDGTPRPASPSWAGTAFVTGNKNIFLKLTETRVNPEAAQLRVFEIPLENYAKLESLTHASDFIELTNSVRSGYGGVGMQFLRFVMGHQPQIKKQLWNLVNKISQKEEVRHGKERFYIYQIACTVIAGKILKHLGLVQFDIARMYDWAITHMSCLRDSASEHQRSAEEDFASMLATLVGEGKVLSTPLANYPNPEFPLRGPPVMRIIRLEQQVYLSIDGFLRYCTQAAKSPNKFRQTLVDAGCFLSNNTTTFALGTGIPGIAVGSTRCYRLDYAKTIGPVADTLDTIPDNVVAFTQGETA